MTFKELNLYKAMIVVSPTNSTRTITLATYIAIEGDTAQAAYVVRPRVGYNKFEIRSIEQVGKIAVES